MANKETEYYSETEIINSTRVLTASIMLLFLSFSLIDFWSNSSTRPEVFIARSLVISCLLASYLMTFISKFHRYMNIVMPSIIMIASIALIYMIYKSSPDESVYSIYFVSLVLMIMTFYSWTYIKFSSSLIISYTLVAVYVYIERYTRSIELILPTAELLANISIIISAVIISVVARLMRDRVIYKNIQLQHSLSKALEAMTEEAKDNAHLANHDELTGLANRRYATELLEKSLEFAKKRDKVLVIMFIDLNGFKQINDEYGHATGDDVLTIVARRLEFSIRKSDCLSRIGGDEYLIGLLIDKDNYLEVESMAKKFSTIISEPMNVDGVQLQVGASVGVAAYPMHGDQIKTLMDIADSKMYQVKKGRKAESIDAKKENNEFSNRVIAFPKASTGYS